MKLTAGEEVDIFCPSRASPRICLSSQRSLAVLSLQACQRLRASSCTSSMTLVSAVALSPTAGAATAEGGRCQTKAANITAMAAIASERRGGRGPPPRTEWGGGAAGPRRIAPRRSGRGRCNRRWRPRHHQVPSPPGAGRGDSTQRDSSQLPRDAASERPAPEVLQGACRTARRQRTRRAEG